MILKRLNIIIILFFPFLFCIHNYAQESHFSQVTKTPLLNNPASVGLMDEETRISNHYRNQWRSIDIPYNTIYLGLEKKIRIQGHQFGLGFNILNDLSKSNIIATNNFGLSLNYSYFHKNNQFVVGGQVASVMKNYDAHGITFGNQFNDGFYNPSLPSGENIDNTANYFDFNTGIAWRSKMKNLKPMAGFSVHHLNTPNISFINDDKEESILPVRYTINGQIFMPLVHQFDLTPLFYYSILGRSHDLIAGSILGYNLEEMNISIDRIYGMSMLRINPSRNIDAFILGTGIELYNFDIGLSYDFNISSLRKISHFRGAIELSLIFKTGKPKVKGSEEPCYML